MKVKVKKLNSNAVINTYANPGDAGIDLTAVSKSEDTYGNIVYGTGLAFEIPEGYEIQVRPRSGLAFKNGVTVLNTPGTIDSDYRGELKIIFINLGEEPFTINNNDRIAQIILSPVTQANFVPATLLSQTERGSGGFGSTGV